MPSQLSHHSIVIRKRSLIELADLSLRVMWRVLPNLLILYFPFAFCAFLLNWVLFGGMEDWVMFYDVEPELVLVWYYIITFFVMWMSLPFVASPMTAYLGLYVFSGSERLQKREAMAVWFERFPQIFWYLVLWRPFFVLHTFLSPIILLEKTPMKPVSRDTLTTVKRSKLLHKDRFGDNLVFALFVIIVGGFTLFGLYVISSNFLILFIGKSETSLWFFQYLLIPFLLWGVMFPFCVMQFLRYLDLRIEREGWDVELSFRVERMRMLDTGLQVPKKGKKQKKEELPPTTGKNMGVDIGNGNN